MPPSGKEREREVRGGRESVCACREREDTNEGDGAERVRKAPFAKAMLSALEEKLSDVGKRSLSLFSLFHLSFAFDSSSFPKKQVRFAPRLLCLSPSQGGLLERWHCPLAAKEVAKEKREPSCKAPRQILLPPANNPAIPLSPLFQARIAQGPLSPSPRALELSLTAIEGANEGSRLETDAIGAASFTLRRPPSSFSPCFFH